MRVLVLTFYFRPDLSAGSFRVSALVEALAEQLPEGSAIDVVTTQPNRYASFEAQAPAEEQSGSVTIRRIALPPHQSGMVDQSRAFAVFARQAWGLARRHAYDLVFASTSRLMTGVLGAAIARRQKAPFYLDIRDIFTETMREVLGRSPLRAVMPVFDRMEAWTLKRATRVNLVSPGFMEHFRRFVPADRISVFTNGIDSEFLERDFSGEGAAANAEKIILYAGNLGDGQALHRILPEAARRLAGQARFEVIGDGGRKRDLQEALERSGVANVTLGDPLPRSELMQRYAEADVLFLHLNDFQAFRRVLPSKLFEYAATGKPILAGVAGSSAAFLAENVAGAEVFPPCDAQALVEAWERLPEGPFDRTGFRTRFDRRNLMRDMAEEVLSVAR